MSRIKFELTDHLRELLTNALADDKHQSRQGEIKNSLKEELVSFHFLAKLIPPGTMGEHLKGSSITFRRPPSPESELQRRFRLESEEKAYLQMVGRTRQVDEWREARVQLSGAANALLSIVGAGVAVGVLVRKSLGWSLEHVL